MTNTIHGFPAGSVDSLKATLTRTGKQYRKWADEYLANGNQEKADYYNKEADRNLSEVNFWLARQEREAVK